MSWKSTDMGEYFEIVPLNDTVEHLAGDECWCKPIIEQEKDSRPVIIHNHSFDLRLLEMTKET